MRFLVDAQLPPGLAKRMREAGHRAQHVYDLRLGGADDRRIWNRAAADGAVLITKDEDFAELARRYPGEVQVVWIRLGNTTNRALWQVLAPLIPEIVESVSRGETLIEIA